MGCGEGGEQLRELVRLQSEGEEDTISVKIEKPDDSLDGPFDTSVDLSLVVEGCVPASPLRTIPSSSSLETLLSSSCSLLSPCVLRLSARSLPWEDSLSVSSRLPPPRHSRASRLRLPTRP